VTISRGGYDPEGNATSVHDRRALDASFSPLHWAFACLLATARSLGDAAVHDYRSPSSRPMKRS
jgi:hypothetical protein